MIKILFMGLQPKSKASISSNKFFKQTRLTTDVKSTNTVAGSIDNFRNWGIVGLISFLVHSQVYVFV